VAPHGEFILIILAEHFEDGQKILCGSHSNPSINWISNSENNIGIS